MNAIDELNSYVESNEISGALLLTGKWGCGKTYLVKQFKEQIDQTKFAVIILSLFGTNNLSVLTQRIREQVALVTFPSVQALRNKATKNNKWLHLVLKGLKQQAQIAEQLSSVTHFVPIENEIGLGGQKRRLVLIFDDLERSDIPKKELLGAINEYVETKKIKTVLIATEDRIKDDDYREIKEKVVSRTLKLSPDYSSIIHELIQSFAEKEVGYKAFLSKQESRIIQLFAESQSENLRTLKSVLIDYERVFACLNKMRFDEGIASKILYSFGAMLFEQRAGNYQPGEYGFFVADSKLQEKYSSDTNRHRLISLQKWVTEGEWDEDEVCNEYRQRFYQEDISSEEKFIHWSFWDLNDTIVREGFPLAIQKAYDGELTGKLLMNLLTKIALARKWNIALPQNVDYDRIEKGLALRIQRIKDNEIEEPEHHTFITPEEREVLNEQERKLYFLAYDIGNDLLSHLKNRSSFIASMSAGDEVAIRQLKNYYYISFDHEMSDSLFTRYATADADIKRAIAHVVSEIDFKDLTKPQEKESCLSLECLKKLLENVDALCEKEKDSFARILDQEFIKVISGRIRSLEK